MNWQMLRSAQGHRVIWQDGTSPGFYSLCVVYPDLHMGIVLLANELDPPSVRTFTAMANHIMTTIEPRAVALP